MRTTIVLGILALLALGVLAWVFLGVAPRRSGVIATPQGGEVPEGVADPRTGGVRQAVEPAPAEATSGPPSMDPLPRKDEDSFWRQCTGLPPDEVRECIRTGLGASVPTPAELAAMACTGGPPDGADLLLVVEVIHRWEPADVPAGLSELGGRCPGSQDMAIGLVRELFPSDPVWCDRVAAAIVPELAFAEGTEGTGALLALADALAEAGFQDQRLLLEAGARGDYGGNDEQGAFALVNAWALQPEERARIDFLAGVLQAPNFRGRPRELRTLVECAIDPAIVEEDARSALDLVERILSHPAHARGAAQVLIELHRLARLPRWLTTGAGGAILARAKTLGS